MAATQGYGKLAGADALVLCLDAADRNSYPGTGTAWSDVSGNNNNGTLTNGPTFSSANGGSIVFDGTNDYVSIPGNSSTLSTLTVYTVELLIKATHSGNKVILEKGANLKMLIQPDQTNQLYYGDYTLFTDSVSIFNGNWINICIVQSLSVRSLYINNQLKNTTNLGPSAANSNDIVLMSRAGSFAQSGNISNFKIYNRALTASEIQHNYNIQKTRFGL
jgi:hypothetical protein